MGKTGDGEDVKSFPKSKRIKVTGAKYKALQERVLERDDYTCQVCSRYTEAPPHHVKYRSRGGSDTMDNLKTVCVFCHDDIHHGGRNAKCRQKIQGKNPVI